MFLGVEVDDLVVFGLGGGLEVVVGCDGEVVDVDVVEVCECVFDWVEDFDVVV